MAGGATIVTVGAIWPGIIFQKSFDSIGKNSENLLLPIKMKINDFIHRYPTTIGIRREGICRVRTFVDEALQATALLTDLGDRNTGASITNSIETVCQSLLARGVVPENCSFVEHYEDDNFRPGTFDLVVIDQARGVDWQPIARTALIERLNCDERELSVKTFTINRLLNEIDRIRYEIDPFIDSPWLEDPAITKRRNDIEDKMITKAQIKDLVECAAGERALQNLLKQDLSIFAEIYADPKDEYICFSEFPVADGAVDFVVFSGRSRMDVTLIEVKGAEFDLVNQGNYEKFAAKVDEAIHQIRNRLRYVIDEVKEFRSQVHQIRTNVESGKAQHNSLLGPLGHLEVDPDKDINIRCIVIGGRTRDDLEESRKRHDVERGTHPPIRVESWDTLIRKIRRE